MAQLDELTAAVTALAAAVAAIPKPNPNAMTDAQAQGVVDQINAITASITPA